MKPASPQPAIAQWYQYAYGDKVGITLCFRCSTIAERAQPSIAFMDEVSIFT